ncbi:formylglycine-generating enzyme family protein [Massilia sp. LXY-6]|uniref:formylglycine-generating enzyme family protein n=1 Tax=Massilia sp. LXY-6 TaxID=3379823 RepID=UPI003EE06759
MQTRLPILCVLAAVVVIAMTAPAGAAVVPARTQSGDVQLAGVVPKNSAEQFELAFWNSIKDSKQAGDYEAYLHAYPKGRFAVLAWARIQQLKAAPPQASAPAPAPATAPRAAAVAPRPAEAAPKPQQGKQQGKAGAVPAPAGGDDQEVQPAPGVTGAVATVKDCDACPLMVALYPVPFTMGSNGSDPSERPAHKVALRTPFAIGKYEVTVGQWNQCVKAGVCPSVPSSANAAENLPMRDVSWDEAQLYLKWLSTVSRRPYRLPTEAEWEYAARGGTTTRYWWGDQMKGGNSSCEGCGEPWKADGPPPVGSFVANPFGLLDMNGSVWEWVQDCWHSSYKGAPADGSAWTDGACQSRVIRGGSWREDGSYMLSTTRFKYDASVRQSQNGFRVARSLK